MNTKYIEFSIFCLASGPFTCFCDSGHLLLISWCTAKWGRGCLFWGNEQRSLFLGKQISLKIWFLILQGHFFQPWCWPCVKVAGLLLHGPSLKQWHLCLCPQGQVGTVSCSDWVKSHDLAFYECLMSLFIIGLSLWLAVSNLEVFYKEIWDS